MIRGKEGEGGDILYEKFISYNKLVKDSISVGGPTMSHEEMREAIYS